MILSIETVKEANTPKPPTNSQHISIYMVPFAELSREINSVRFYSVDLGIIRVSISTSSKGSHFTVISFLPPFLGTLLRRFIYSCT
jgi:hypothetical protein